LAHRLRPGRTHKRRLTIRSRMTSSRSIGHIRFKFLFGNRSGPLIPHPPVSCGDASIEYRISNPARRC
jgi:hypothetical protein